MDSQAAALWMKSEIEKRRREEIDAAPNVAPKVSEYDDAPVVEDLPEQSDPKPAPAKTGKSVESRRWMLTLPEAEYDQDYVERSLGKYKAVTGQLEVAPTTGYRHWQLYLENSSAVRFSTLRKLFPKGFYKPAKETRISCVRYCTKAESFAGVSVSLGEIDLKVKQGTRTDFDSYLEQIVLEGKAADEVIHDDPRAVVFASHLRQLELIRDRQTWGRKFREIEVHYIHGGTRTGKTSALYETYGYSGIYRVPNWKNPFDGYRGEDVLLLDEYNTSVAIVDLLKILEGYPLEVSARYADKIAKFTKVFIVSNLRLESQHKTIQQEHPEQWEAFKARLTSVSEMLQGGKLAVAKGVPPQLDHYLTGKPVEVLVRIEEVPKPSTGALVTEIDESDHLDYDDEELSEFFD